MKQKRVGLMLSSEETYPDASLGIVHQIQEYARYTHSEFVGVVRGFGNSRGEVTCDPHNPVIAAQYFGASFFTQKFTDYRIDTERSGKVWAMEADGADSLF